MPSNFWKKPKYLLLILLLLAGIAVIILQTGKEPKTVPSEVLPEVVPIASGKQTYEILTDSSQKFKIMEVGLDPLDVKQGKTQTVQVLVKDAEDNPITRENLVEAVVYTDNTATPFTFSLKKVQDLDSATVTTWEGFWVLEDAYDLRYTMAIKAKSAGGEHSIDLTFR